MINKTSTLFLFLILIIFVSSHSRYLHRNSKIYKKRNNNQKQEIIYKDVDQNRDFILLKSKVSELYTEQIKTIKPTIGIKSLTMFFYFK